MIFASAVSSASGLYEENTQLAVLKQQQALNALPENPWQMGKPSRQSITMVKWFEQVVLEVGGTPKQKADISARQSKRTNAE